MIGAGPVPGAGPLIVVANHTSILDGILIHAVIRCPLRIFVAAEWVAWWPLRLLFRIMGAIPVDRDRRNPAALDRAVEALERGDVVALFPEGGIQMGGGLGAFRNGASRLALRTGVSVLPCAIIGSSEALPWPRRFPRPLRIIVRHGEILRVGGPVRDVTVSDGGAAASSGSGSPARAGRRSRVATRSSPEALAAATARIREAVRALLDEGRGDEGQGGERHGEIEGKGGVPTPSSPGGIS